jgi:hypothetical protein
MKDFVLPQLMDIIKKIELIQHIRKQRECSIHQHETELKYFQINNFQKKKFGLEQYEQTTEPLLTPH